MWKVFKEIQQSLTISKKEWKTCLVIDWMWRGILGKKLMFNSLLISVLRNIVSVLILSEHTYVCVCVCV